MVVLGLEFVLHGVKQDPGHRGIYTYIGIMNYIGCLTETVVRNDANNNTWDESAVQEDGNIILSRGIERVSTKEFYMWIFIQGVVTGRKECASCLVFVVTYFVKGVYIFVKVVAGFGALDIMGDVLGVL